MQRGEASAHESGDRSTFMMNQTTILVSNRAGDCYALEGGAKLTHVRNFLSMDERDTLWHESLTYPWQRQKIRGVETLRANAWFAEDPRAVYAYSGQCWSPRPFGPALTALRDRLLAVFVDCSGLNACLATRYPNGTAAVGWHADDEPLFGENPIVVSLSLGAVRTFQVAPNGAARSGRAALELQLGDGDLVVMGGSFQHLYKHALKKASKGVGSRLNLSFRQVIGFREQSGRH